MFNMQLYNVAPKIPDKLKFLERLSYNMWWSWHPVATDLFMRIEPRLWREARNNSRKFLGLVSQERLEELAKDQSYLRQLSHVQIEFENQIPAKEDLTQRKIAYFSMEYGIHESVGLYSGGLGILSGDHLKAASDEKLPIVGVGLLYRQGYFRQVLDRNGWQIERYPDNEIHHMPLTRACDNSGNEVFVSVKLCDREVIASVWTLMVGEVPLLLLDTELPQNAPESREITGRLYGGDRKMRLEQELLLGIGGFKALLAVGYEPAVCHMNEGHAAFLSLARMEHLVKSKGFSPETALEVVWRTNVFTTHTPVPAGNEVFSRDLVYPYLQVICEDIGIDTERVISWGVPIQERDKAKEICMTILGLRMGGYSNGVSRLHGVVARKMWRHLWPNHGGDEIPIGHVTNGVHIASWVGSRMRQVYNRYLNLDWMSNPNIRELREKIAEIPDEELWMAHELCRHNLIGKARQLMLRDGKYRRQQGFETVHGESLLSPGVLTIGFARRFATYKRGTLLLRNQERLQALLGDRERPIQLVFAGKAHPADEEGKRLIQQMVQFSQSPEAANRVVFLEDYDIELAKTMIQGVDVWLNTPRRPQEASGTSGMKAAANGVLNCSILDGWWDEAYKPERGWAIIGDDSYETAEDCDNFESNALFNLLENEIIPCFYARGESDLPRKWVAMMKESIVMALGTFSSARMVKQYNHKYYNPALQEYERLMLDKADAARALVKLKSRYIDNFGKIHLSQPGIDHDLTDVHVGDMFKISVEVFLDGLKPEEVEVSVYYGMVNPHNEIVTGSTAVMELAEDLGKGSYLYRHELQCSQSGRFGLTARITPPGKAWRHSMPGFIRWANPADGV